jgi:parvulin-like peptidyl-prolyl isomerase
LASLLKDPLVHFVLLGAAIFGLFAVLEDGARDDRRIVVTAAEVDSLWQAMSVLYGEAPTEADIRQLVEPRIREEVLYREALALGLDKDDSQIRQRLVEKMTFLTEDLLPAAPPTEAELAEFFLANRQAFEEPPRLSFEQIYFSPSEHGEGVVAAAEAARESLLAHSDAPAAGSSGTVARSYESVTMDALRGEFGGEFAEAVFALGGDVAWHGPIRSLFGAHLVRVTGRSEARPPTFGEARERVEAAFNAERRRLANEAAYQALREHFDIVIEIPDPVRSQWQTESQSE